MKIAGEEITLSDLFDDKSNPKSLAYGLFGFTHLLLSLIAMGLMWLITLNLGYINLRIGFKTGLALMFITASLTSYWWYRRETKKHTVSLFKERSTPFVTLDTRLDFFTPLVGSFYVFGLWWFYNV